MADSYTKKLNRYWKVYDKKPKVMVDDQTNQKFKVHYWFILENCWEYYLGKIDSNGNAFGYVMGFENEWGSVNVDELQKHISGMAMGEDEMPCPAIGFSWEEK